MPKIDKENKVPFSDGDALIVLRPDGLVETFTIGVDQELASEIRLKDPQAMSKTELDLALQGQMLFLLTMAAKSDAVMHFLAKVATVSSEPTSDTLKRAMTTH
jgi:hypothetical protein